jgi:mannosyltransferase OCH1-like enzyme
MTSNGNVVYNVFCLAPISANMEARMPERGKLDSVQGLWIGPALSSMEQMCIRSFLANGHPFYLYTYDDIKNVPTGTTIIDAHQILPPTMIFKYQDHRSYAGFSNYFRYKLLLERGGIWSDLDAVCVQPLAFEEEFVFASQLTPGGQEVAVPGFIKAAASSPIMEYVLTECLGRDVRQIKYAETGPILFHAAVEKFGMQRFVRSANAFCPIPYFQWDTLISDAELSLDENVFTVHLWNEMWRRAGMDKDGSFPASCLYQQLRDRFGCNSDCGRT